MTIHTTMKMRALAEFDRLAQEAELSMRAHLAAHGKSPTEIETAIRAVRPNVREQRAQVGNIVTIALLQSRLPISKGNIRNAGS